MPSVVIAFVAASRRRLLIAAGLALTALVLLTLTTAATRADYQGPDENTSQAWGPLQGDHAYAATINAGGSDQDWYYFYVPAAGDQLHWTVSNTTPKTGCTPSGPYYCNLYATLEDSNGQQVGGADSSAGTSGVGPGTSQHIDWTFTSPGKYYIAFIGDGDQLSYQFSVTPASGVSSTAPGSAPTPKLDLRAHQARRDVDFSLTSPAGGGRLEAVLYLSAGGASSRVASLHRSHVGAGRARFAVRLSDRAWRQLARRHHLHFTLRVTLTRAAGSPLRASRGLLLRRR